MNPTKSKVAAINTVTIIGCGGVASYLLPALLRTFKVNRVILHDGDTLEERNLDRQLFSSEHIGMNKAEAQAILLRAQFPRIDFDVVPEYFSEGSHLDAWSTVLVCVDNHAARANALRVADQNDCVVVIAGNEYTDAQSMIYLKEWQGTTLDPRVRYPDILTDQSDDPRRPESCQGALQQAHPQLAMANFSAANHALWLLWFWKMERDKLDPDVAALYSPIEHSNNFNRFRTMMSGDFAKKAEVAA
jgi:hypothetical protein